MSREWREEKGYLETLTFTLLEISYFTKTYEYNGRSAV